MRLPVYFTGVRTYFAVTTALAVFVVLLLIRPDSAGVAEATVFLELLTPLPLLLVSAGLLQRDSALSLIAACQVNLNSLLLARWALGLTGVLIVPVGAQVALAVVHADANFTVLTWLAPTAFLSGLGLAGAAVTASSGAGTGVALVYWAVSLLATPVLQDVCAEALPAPCTAALWSSAYGLIAATGPGWVMNRVVLLLGALVLLNVAAYAYRNPERQVRATASPEATT